MKSVLITVLTFCLTWMTTLVGDACTIIAVGKGATTDGSVIVSHTDAGKDSRIHVVHGQDFPPGSTAPVHWGMLDPKRPLEEYGEVIGEIPQVEKTFTYLHSAYSHINEHQLAIGESTIDQRPELVVERGQGEQIMTIEQAQVFALQRCRTAREAVQLVGQLMEQYGFLPSSGDGAETLAIADPDEVWILEVFGVGIDWTRSSGEPGAIWAAQRVPDNNACMIPNWSIIKEIDPSDRDNFIVSKHYKTAAIERGWYDPKSDAPFIWQEVYAPIPVEYATSRFWLFHHRWAPSLRDWPNRMIDKDRFKTLNQYFQYVEPLSIYPFSIEPESKISVRDVIDFQRSTFEGTIYDFTLQPQWLVVDEEGHLATSPLATPFPSSDLRRLLKLTNRRPVARHRGHYGMVTQLRSWLPDAIGGVYWVYLDNPKFSPYVPIYAGVQQTAESYQIFDPEAYSDRSARWTIDFVDNLANLRYQDAIRDVEELRAPFEDGFFEKQAAVEAEALELFETSPDVALDYLTAYCQKAMNDVPALYISIRERLLVKYTNNRE